MARGEFFDKLDIIKRTDATNTATGLTISSFINDKEYHIKRPVDSDFKINLNNQITFDDKIPKWNYLIKPN